MSQILKTLHHLAINVVLKYMHVVQLWRTKKQIKVYLDNTKLSTSRKANLIGDTLG